MAKGQDTFTPISDMLRSNNALTFQGICLLVLSVPFFKLLVLLQLPKSVVPDPDNLELWLKVDDEVRQKGSTSNRDMIFKIPYLMSHISSIMTLLEGDVILIGTPQGVGPVEVGQKIAAGITGPIDVHFDVQRRQRPGC